MKKYNQPYKKKSIESQSNFNKTSINNKKKIIPVKGTGDARNYSFR